MAVEGYLFSLGWGWEGVQKTQGAEGGRGEVIAASDRALPGLLLEKAGPLYDLINRAPPVTK